MRQFLHLELRRRGHLGSSFAVGLAVLIVVVATAPPASAQDNGNSLRAEKHLRLQKKTNPAFVTQQKAALRNLRKEVTKATREGKADYVSAVQGHLRRISRERRGQPDEHSVPVDEGIRTIGRFERRSLLRGNATLRRNTEQMLREVENGLRVVGGTQVISDEVFQDAVAIRRYVGGRAGVYVCTGVLFRRDAVLTAAHCVCDLRLATEPSAGEVLLVLTGNVASGSLSDARSNGYEIDATRTQLISNTFCQNYKRNRLWHGQDLAVLFLKLPVPKDVPLAEFVTPELYLRADTGVLTVVGFGETLRSDVSRVNRPKFAAAVAIASKLCDGRNGNSKFLNCTPGSEMVLSDWFSRDTCGGDSGGPAYMNDAGRYLVAAITSRALDEQGGECGPGGVYSIITPRVRAWLDEVAPRPKEQESVDLAQTAQQQTGPASNAADQ